MKVGQIVSHKQLHWLGFKQVSKWAYYHPNTNAIITLKADKHGEHRVSFLKGRIPLPQEKGYVRNNIDFHKRTGGERTPSISDSKAREVVKLIQ